MDQWEQKVSSFEKLAYGQALPNGYRLATVYEAEELYKAIKKRRDEVDKVAGLELLPPQGSEDAYRLKDGYLFDWGTLRSFYPDHDQDFKLPHKLSVKSEYLADSNKRAPKLWLPLALLHACEAEDLEEIQEIVDNAWKSDNCIELSEISKINIDTVQIKGKIEPKWDRLGNIDGSMNSELVDGGSQQTINFDGAGSTSCTNTDDTTKTLAGLALLKCKTPWVDGGTALHYAARAAKPSVANFLLEQEMRLIDNNKDYPKSQRLVNCVDYMGNTPLCCAAQQSNREVVDQLKWHSNVKHYNLFGNTALHLAAKQGHFSALFVLADMLGIRIEGEELATLGDQLKGTNFMHHLVLRAVDGDQLDEALDNITKSLEYPHPAIIDEIKVKYQFGYRNHLGLSAFDVALSNGRSQVCAHMLRGYFSSSSTNAEELDHEKAEPLFRAAQCDYSRLMVDGDGNNILHRYAAGGADKEVGKLILQWLQLGANARQNPHSLPLFERRVKEFAKVDLLITELNVDGETPCITALRRGHSDAFEVLMPFWKKELASQYLHAETRDNILHCFAKSIDPPSSTYFHLKKRRSKGLGVQNWSDLYPPGDKYLENILNARNEHGHTPVFCALQSGQVNSLQWFLKQDNLKLEPHNVALHLFACHFDDNVLARSLLQKLGDENVKQIINMRMELYEEFCAKWFPINPLEFNGLTPLEIAIKQGNARTCVALLEQNGIVVELGNMLHVLCESEIEDPRSMWQKLTQMAENAPTLGELINARNSDDETPLMVALRSGNIVACKWLLETLQHQPEKPVPVEDSAKIFRCFAEGDCSDTFIWEKIKELFLTQENANTIDWTYSLSAALTGGSEECALLFLREPNDILDKFYGFWNFSPAYKSFNLMRSMSFKVLAQIRRSKYYTNIYNNLTFLANAAASGWCQMFDMALQAQDVIEIQEQTAAGDSNLFSQRRNKYYKDFHTLFSVRSKIKYFTDRESRRAIYEKLDKPQDRISGSGVVFDNDKQLCLSILKCDDLSKISCCLQLLAMKRAEENTTPLTISLHGRSEGDISMGVLMRAAAWLWAGLHLLEVRPTALKQEGQQKESNDQIQANFGEDGGVKEKEGTSGTTNSSSTDYTELEKRFLCYLSFRLDDEYVDEDRWQISLVQFNCTRNTLLHGAPNVTKFLHQIRKTNPEVVALMLQLTNATCAELCTSNLLHKYSTSGLHRNVHAVFYSVLSNSTSFNYEVMKELLAHPLAVEMKMSSIKHTRTILHEAASSSEGTTEAVLLLMSLSRRLQMEGITDYEGKNALHCAYSAKRRGTAFSIMSICPELAKVGRRSGRTPLHDSAFNGDAELVEDILMFNEEKNALLNERDADGRTALHYAAASDKPAKRMKIVKMLVAHARREKDYAALLLWASAGHLIGTAYKVAQAARHADVAAFLKQEMEEERNKIGDLLQHALKKKNYLMARDFINQGADISTLPPEILEKLELHQTRESDQPAKKDYLGRAGLVKGIAALLLNPFTATPITIGVFGPWGMGKSSIMLQIEITLLMTMIERNVLSTYHIEEAFLRLTQEKNNLTTKGIMLHSNISKAVPILTKKNYARELKDNVITKQSFRRIISEFTKGSFLRCWRREKKEDDSLDVKKFLSNYIPQCKPLYKGLALMDPKYLFVPSQLAKNTRQQSQVRSIPPCITIYYNTWLYHAENEASSGLAFNILKELEDCMDTAQWLRLCWKYAYKSNPIYIFSNLTLPLIVFITLGGWILWLLWKLLSLPSLEDNAALKDFKYGSLPVSMLVVTWLTLRNIVNIVKPVSEQIFQSLSTKNIYKERLGYQQKIINDIQFFKEQLGEKAGFGWKVISKIWIWVIENKDNIPFTNIKKAIIPSKNLRIIVFVDDLDRCTSSKYVLELLGAINLILSVCDINVVLGIDKEIIQEVIKKEYPEDKEVGENFLEKIVQLPIHLYDASEQDLSAFLQEQIRGQLEEEMENTRSINKECLSSLPLHGISNTSHPINMNAQDNVIEGQSTLMTTINIGDTRESHVNSSLSNEIIEETPKILRENASSSSRPHASQKIIEQMSRSNQQTRNTLEAQEGLAIEFPVLVANYNTSELKTFQYLQSKAKGSHRQPRIWKRLLNYHRLAWYIISQSKLPVLQHFYGWQEQLIIWVFICHNWTNQMNQIFKNWDMLSRKLKSEGDINIYTLQHLVSLYKEMRREQLKAEEKEWEELEDVLLGKYDIDLPVLHVFQNYRLHCDARYLEWE